MGLSSSRNANSDTYACSEAGVAKKQRLRFGQVKVDVEGTSSSLHSRRGEAQQYVIPGSCSGLLYDRTASLHNTAIRRAAQAIQEMGGEPMYIPL